MKQKICLFSLMIGMIITTSINSQVTNPNNTFSANAYCGWSSSNPLDFKINSNLYMTLNTGGNVSIGNGNNTYMLDVNNDINAGGSTAGTTRGYYIGGNKVLWHTGSITTLAVGVGAGFTGIASGFAAQNTFVGADAGYKTTADGGFNTFLGYSAGYWNKGTSGVGGAYNTYIGDEAGYGGTSNNTSSHNTFVGYIAGYNNTADYNTFFGDNSGFGNTSGSGNAYFGSVTGIQNATGSNNTLMGYGAANGVGAVRSFSNNSYFGYGAGQKTTTSGDNVAIGYLAMYTQTWDNTNSAYSTYNVAVGNKALYTNNPTTTSNGWKNTALGYQTGYSNTTGSANLFSGYEAGYTNTSGGTNVFLGYQAGKTNLSASDNTFVGSQAGYLNSTGTGGAFFGDLSGYNNTASGNSFFGHNAGNANTSGAQNVGIGLAAGYYNATGSNNTSCGYGAGFGVTGNSNANNSFFGYKAGYKITTGGNNMFSGYQAGYNVTTGGQNVFAGYLTGQVTTGGSNNTLIGSSADVCATCTTITNATAIGYGAIVNATNDFVLGNSSVAVLRCQVQTISTLSDGRIKNNVQENVPGLAFIKLLKPVTYKVDIHTANNLMGYPTKKDSAGNVIGIDTSYWQGKYDVEKVSYTGFIAQQVETAAQTVGYDFSGVVKPNNPNDLYSLDYSKFVVPLVKALQELDSTVTALQEQLATSNLRTSNPNTNPDSVPLNQKDVTLSNKKIVLNQNEPNPFKEQTTITYEINADFTNAFIIFTDMAGQVIKEVVITEKGKGQLNVFASDLSTGIYTYTIVVDGITIDTKKMVK